MSIESRINEKQPIGILSEEDFAYLPVPFFLISNDGKICFVNSAGKTLCNRMASELLSTSVESLIHPDTIPDFRQFLCSIIQERKIETCILKWRRNEGKFVSVSVKGGISSHSEMIQLVMTESVADSDFKKSYKKEFEDISNVANIGRWELDLVQNALLWSQKIYEIFELDQKYFHPSYEAFLSVIHPEDREKVNEAYTKSLIDQKKYEIEHRLLMADGRIKWVRETCYSEFDLVGKPLKSIGTCQDITKHKELEFFLQEREASYFTLVENTSSLVWSCDREGRFTFLNPAWETVLGYNREEMIDRSHSDFQPFDISIRDQEAITKFNQDGEITKAGYETIYLTKEGQIRYLVFYPTAVFDAKGNIIGSHGTAIDVTSKRILDMKLEETYFELGQRQFAIDQHAIVAITNLEGDIIYVNRLFCEISKYKREELIGKNHRIINSGYHPPEFFKELYRTIKKGETWHGEIKNKSKDGNFYWVATTIAPIKNSKGEIEKYLSIRTDITETKEADEKIQSLLDEKSLILIEVHHRIKNNMNTIYSLLRMEAEQLKEPSQKTILFDASNRVRSMMLLYDKLYRSENSKIISIKEYLPVLISEIINIFPNKGTIITEIQVEPALICASKLSCIGIIINELITNSMKYSFIGKSEGKITFHTRVENDSLIFRYEDNGNPMDSTVNFQSSNGFGLNLIHMLVQQLKGSVKIERDQGTRYTMEFKL